MDRKSVVLKTRIGHYFVTPDNGTLTFVAPRPGIAEVREIDEAVNRRKDSEKSYTLSGPTSTTRRFASSDSRSAIGSGSASPGVAMPSSN